MESHEIVHNRYGTGNIDVRSMEKKFLKLYKQLTLLWKPSHPDYNNRCRRNAAYDALLPIYRQYMPKATRFHIRQKINIIRSCYRKELRKHLASRSVNSEGKIVYGYIPTSWKFHALRFLDSEEDGDSELDTSTEIEPFPDFEDDEEPEFIQDNDLDSVSVCNNEQDTSKICMSPLLTEEENTIPHKRRNAHRHWNTSTHSTNNDEEVLQKEYKAIGANVACKLHRMSAQQRYHAELLINKVLIKGLNERLSEDTDLTDVWHVDEAMYVTPSKEEIIEKHSNC